jgi:transposase
MRVAYEKFFSKLKGLLRKAAKRDIDDLWKEIGELLNGVTASECTNFFASSGYVNT